MTYIIKMCLYIPTKTERPDNFFFPPPVALNKLFLFIFFLILFFIF